MCAASYGGTVGLEAPQRAARCEGEETVMSDNKTVVKRFVTEYQNGRDDEVLSELVTPDVVDHSTSPGMPPGIEGVKAFHDGFHAAFSGLQADIHQQVAEGDMVVTRKTFRGTHTGDFMGIPPTGRDIELGVIDIVRIRDGQIAEHWNQLDQLGLLRQLGVVSV
jgi:predicted ester cyclase